MPVFTEKSQIEYDKEATFLEQLATSDYQNSEASLRPIDHLIEEHCRSPMLSIGSMLTAIRPAFTEKNAVNYRETISTIGKNAHAKIQGQVQND